jgi:hypothetical protein
LNFNSKLSDLSLTAFSTDQKKIIDNPDKISFNFVLLPHNLRNGNKCWYDKCNNIPTHYLKNSKNNVNGRFCNSCKIVHEKHGLDNDNIKYKHEKSKIEKSKSKITKISSLQKRGGYY